LDSDYSPHSTSEGQGAHVYVADTGININHPDFESRATPAIDYYFTSNYQLTVCDASKTDCAHDRQSHGTHCAGTIGSKTWGVAKKTALYAVKVLSDSGSGSFSGIVGSVDWVTSYGNKPAVWSASLVEEELCNRLRLPSKELRQLV
jgi:subtilisin family serine protease